MAKRGDVARQRVNDGIITAFGDNFVGVQDKKIYVMSEDEGGEKIQFAITITMPKNPIQASATTIPNAKKSNPNDWTGPADPQAVVTTNTTPAQVSDEDAAEVARLMAQLGITSN